MRALGLDPGTTRRNPTGVALVVWPLAAERPQLLGATALLPEPAESLADFLDKNPDVKKDWDTKVGDRMQKIVFIGQHLDRKAIEAELDKCLAE